MLRVTSIVLPKLHPRLFVFYYFPIFQEFVIVYETNIFTLIELKYSFASNKRKLERNELNKVMLFSSYEKIHAQDQ